ncbi:MAG: hypothetical protein ACI9C4_001756 [Paraglaciecola sp.]|jgi:hypothetical protein
MYFNSHRVLAKDTAKIIKDRAQVISSPVFDAVKGLIDSSLGAQNVFL